MAKVFLVRGSSRGLGRQIAEAVSGGGHRWVATARRPESLADLVALHGDRILPLALDVADEGVGVYYAASQMEAQACANGAVVVVGGGTRPAKRPSSSRARVPGCTSSSGAKPSRNPCRVI
jgi:NAD(P)-dependent dehydrogenase (short-subunit alcohol dehydrogenase family)